MTFTQILLTSVKEMLPSLLLGPLLLIPFIIAEQLWPVGEAPRLRDYGLNVLIGLTTAYLSLPLGIAAGLWGSQLHHLLPWTPLSFSFHSIRTIPFVGPELEVVTMIFVPLFLHDLWFYWAHRIEHRVPLLWEFHKIHHSDERLNASTYARDHFLQAAWIGFFPTFTLGLFVDLDLTEAGKAALYSNLFLVVLSMLYHSAIRIRLPWLDRVLVTPQVHRIHHSIDQAHYNRNFADALPLFDIVFGTYHRPLSNEFPVTGLGPDFPAPRTIWRAQFHPVLAAADTLYPRSSRRRILRPR